MIIAMGWLLFALFVTCLIQAMVEDRKYKRVHRCIWWKAGIAGMGMIVIGMLSCQGDTGRLLPVLQDWQCLRLLPYGIPREQWAEVIFELICFQLLQHLFFSRMYGRADVYAFSRCSLAWASFGGGLKEDLLHMLTSVFLLGAVQFLNKNVGSDGNLKKPVAFVPYISAGFFVCLFGRIQGII